MLSFVTSVHLFFILKALISLSTHKTSSVLNLIFLFSRVDVLLFSVSDGFVRRETFRSFQPFEVNSDSSDGELGR